MRLLILGIVSVLFFPLVNAQDYQSSFIQAFENQDSSEMRRVLKEWESADPTNAELFTSYFNYYVIQSMDEIVVLETEAPSGEALVLTDSSGSTAGYMSSEIVYHADTINLAFDKIDQGISLYPDRLDMRFGKIYILGQMENWQVFTEEIIRTIDYSSQNDNQWTWTNNEKGEDGKDFFLSSLQDYQMDLFNTEDPTQFENIRVIARTILKYYPDHLISWSNIGVTYLFSEDYEKAIYPLEKAVELDSNDVIVLGNLAFLYRKQGEIEKSIEYYEKVSKIGNKEDAEFAIEQIKQMKN